MAFEFCLFVHDIAVIVVILSGNLVDCDVISFPFLASYTLDLSLPKSWIAGILQKEYMAYIIINIIYMA